MPIGTCNYAYLSARSGMRIMDVQPWRILPLVAFRGHRRTICCRIHALPHSLPAGPCIGLTWALHRTTAFPATRCRGARVVAVSSLCSPKSMPMSQSSVAVAH